MTIRGKIIQFQFVVQPVAGLEDHITTIMQIAKNLSVMQMLTVTLTSAILEAPSKALDQVDHGVEHCDGAPAPSAAC